MSFTLTGTIIEIGNVQTYTNFKKQEFIVEVKEGKNNEYTNVLKFVAKNNKTDLLSQFAVGSHVTIDFNIKGSKWDKDGRTMYFTDLDMWRMADSGQKVPKETVKEEAWENNTPQEEDNWDDDLPF
jgi:hypothetical protein